MHPIEPKLIEQRQNVGDEEWPAIGSDISWPGRITEAAEVGGDDTVAGFRQRGHLMPPEKPRVRKPCRSKTGGPAPTSTTGKLSPASSTVLVTRFRSIRRLTPALRSKRYSRRDPQRRSPGYPLGRRQRPDDGCAILDALSVERLDAIHARRGVEMLMLAPVPTLSVKLGRFRGGAQPVQPTDRVEAVPRLPETEAELLPVRD